MSSLALALALEAGIQIGGENETNHQLLYCRKRPLNGRLVRICSSTGFEFHRGVVLVVVCQCWLHFRFHFPSLLFFLDCHFQISLSIFTFDLHSKLSLSIITSNFRFQCSCPCSLSMFTCIFSFHVHFHFPRSLFILNCHAQFAFQGFGLNCHFQTSLSKVTKLSRSISTFISNLFTFELSRPVLTRAIVIATFTSHFQFSFPFRTFTYNLHLRFALPISTFDVYVQISDSILYSFYTLL